MQSFNYEKLKSSIQTIVESDDHPIDALENLVKPLNTDKSLDADIKSCMDHSFKNILLNYSKKNVDINVYKSLISLSISVARHDLCTGNLPIILLTDLFEYHTTSECEKLFDLVENLITVWKEDFFFKNVKNQLLRTCNDLLRRLSRSQNTVFCGRILVFLANFFPFFERSGLNLISEFNNDESMQVMFDVEATEFESSSQTNNGQDALSVGEEEDGLISANENVILDFDVYKKFWSLQEYFRMPVLCYKPLHWKKFIDCANETIELFSNFKIDSNNCNIHALDSLEHNYFPKYLTSQKLLELQLCDSNFRRNILVQFLILFQYLVGKVKFKTEQQVLNDDQLKWVKEMSEKIMNLIAQTPSNGKEVKDAIAHILSREEFWSNWKNEACSELKKCNEPANKKQKTSSTNATKISLGERIRKAEQKNQVIIGSDQLTKIWNLNQDNWNACKTKNRLFMPSIETYFESVLDKDSYEYKKYYTEDSTYCWRALRLLSRQSPNFFTPSNNPVKPVREYVESVIDKLYADKQTMINEAIIDQDLKPVEQNEKDSPTTTINQTNNSEELVYNLE